MNDKRMKDALENIARRGVPENINLWPNISARLERKSPMMTLRSRPLVAILITLLILLALSGVAYALGKAFGFIPGIGMLEKTSELRALDKPVSVERDGIRLTVLNVVASSTSTMVRYQVEWLTPPSTGGEYDTTCQGTPSLALADGTPLSFIRTADKFLTGDSGMGYGRVMEFAAVPIDQNDVTFLLPCLVPFSSGLLPHNWEINFQLIPAPDEMVLPVVTVPAVESPSIPPTEAASPSNPTPPFADLTHRISSTVDSFVPLDDGFLLIGSMQWSADDYPSNGVSPKPYVDYVKVIDANGQAVVWEEVYENVKPQNEEYRSYWAIKIPSKNFAAPLTITFNAADVQVKPVSFTFEVGADSKPGQSWDVNQDIQVVDSPVKIVKANLIAAPENNLSFQFDAQVDPNAIGDLRLATSLNQCMGGGGGYPIDHLDLLQVYVAMCRPDLPPGNVEIQVIGAVLWGQWQVTWQP
jgi:hypothetical protein